MRTTFAADVLETLLLSVEDRALGFHQLDVLSTQVASEFDFRVDVTLNHMRARQNLLGDLYPFEVLPVGVVKRPACELSPYVSLLILSPEGIFRRMASARDIDRASLEFERLMEQAIKGLSGPGTSSIRFGWPSEVGRPLEFPDAIAWLGEQMGLRLGRGFRPPRRKDGGVDIISWRKFRDGKSAFPIFLVQCTIQSDLLKKSEDIDLRNWAYWLEFSRDPQPILAAPQELSGQDENWNELSLKCLVLDRPRILELLASSSEMGYPYARCEWATMQLARLEKFVESM